MLGLVLVLVLVQQLWLVPRRRSRSRSYALLDVMFGWDVSFWPCVVVCRSSCSTGGGRGQWTVVVVAVIVGSEGRQQLGPLGRGQRRVDVA